MDHRATANIAEMTTAENSISQLKQQVAKLSEAAGDWIINFDVHVQSDFSIIVTAKTANKEYNRAFSKNDVLYLASDKHSIAKFMVDEFLVSMLADKAMEAVLPKFSKAVDNVVTLTKKSAL